jgi:hypothetical protein
VPPSRSDLALAGAASLPGGLLLLLNAWARPFERVVGNVPDDAFFYLVLARSAVRGGGFSFDGLHETAAVHFPWLLGVLALVTGFGPDEVLRLPRLLLLAHGLLGLVAALLFGRLLLEQGLGASRSALGVLLVGCASTATYGAGMETSLLLVALWGLLLAWRRDAPSTHALLALALVAVRVDMAPLLLLSLPLLRRRCAATLLGGLAGLLLTLTFNLVVGGEPWSSAMAMKALGSVEARLVRLDASVVLRHTPRLAMLALPLACIGLLRGEARRAPILWLTTGGLLALLLAQFGLNNLVAPWYYIALSHALTGAALCSVPSWSPRLLLPLLGLPWALSLARAPGEGLHANVMRFALELPSRLPDATPLLAEDFPGMLAWYADRPVVTGDGLAASPDCRRALLRGELLAWSHEHGVRWYVSTRRRAPWLEGLPRVDRVHPPFLDVPPSVIPLGSSAPRLVRVDPGTQRVLALFELGDDQAAEAADAPDADPPSGP